MTVLDSIMGLPEPAVWLIFTVWVGGLVGLAAAPLTGGWGWELPEEGYGSTSGRAHAKPAAEDPVRPSSESSWLVDLPEGWSEDDVALTLMDIEYAEAYRP